MTGQPWMRRIVAPCILCVSSHASAVTPADLARAHDLVASFAGEICASVPMDSSTSTTELDGDVKLKLDGLLKKLAGLEVGVGGKSITTQTRGVLQGDLAKALQDRNECYLHVFDVVVEQLLIPVPADPEARKMSGRWHSDGMRGLAFLDVVVRGDRFFGTEFGNNGAPYLTYEGTVTVGVFEGNGYFEQNLNPSKGELRVPEREAIGRVQLQLSSDARKLYGQLTVRLRKGNQMASKLDYTRDQ